MAGQARASYPEKTQKKRPKPPSKKSIIPRESRPCVWWWSSVYNYFLEKNWDIGIGAISPPTHQHTSRHADTPTRRHADTRSRHTHSQANTHTPGGGWAVETTANTGEGASSIKAHCSEDSGSGHPSTLRVSSISRCPALLHSLHTRRGAVSVLYGSTPASVTSYLGLKPPLLGLYFSLSLRL